LGERVHFFRARAVGDQGFFHENIQAFLNGVTEVHPAESKRGGEDRNAARLEAVHGVFVAIETDELAVIRNVHLGAMLALEPIAGGYEPFFENVDKRTELDRRTADRQRIGSRAASTAAAADEGHLQGVVLGGVDKGNLDAGEGGNGCNRTSGFDEGTTGGLVY